MKTWLDEIEELREALQKHLPMKPEFQSKLDKKFRLEFNYNSNHIEGNTLTYSETELLLFHSETRGNHTKRELDEMEAHNVAFTMIKEWASEEERQLSETDIKNLNKIILKEPFWKEAMTPDGQQTRRLIKVGDYKEFPNSVRLANGEIFEYASTTDTPILVRELIGWYRDEEKAIHELTLAAMLHYKFVRIHPFDDGNGRIARLLMNFVLLKNNLPPIIIKSTDKTNYIRALHIADTGNYEPFIQYAAEQLIWSLKISIKAAKGENIDEPGDLDKEISLLEQRLKTTGSKIEISRSKEAILQVYDDSINRLVPAFIKVCEKFDRFYIDQLFDIIINGKILKAPRSQALAMSRNNISENTDNITLQYYFKTFNRSGYQEFNHPSQIRFIFGMGGYNVGLATYREALIEKGYGEQLTDEEINILVKRVSQQHTVLIETKLKENENKKNNL